MAQSMWESFESECAKYIEEVYGNEYGVKVIPIGGSDSNLSDIKILKNETLLFNMEVKSSSAQCGQFVVKLDLATGTYIYGQRNFSEENEFVTYILNELNRSDYYINNSNKSTIIKVRDCISINWIKNYYKSKKVEYFITEFNNQKVILHIDNFEKYFNVTCVLRPKKSGSRNISRSNISILHDGLSENFPNYDFTIDDLYFKNGTNLILHSKYKLIKNGISKESFVSNNGEFRFQLEESGINTYYIRRLSNTQNPTVIFNITSKLEQECEDIQRFITSIK